MMRLLGWKMKCFFIVFPILEIKDPFHLKFVLVNELDHLVNSLPSKFSHSLVVWLFIHLMLHVMNHDNDL